MAKDKREFIIKELMEPGFIEGRGGEMILTETEKSGESRLKVRLNARETLCIANIDRKKTDIQFFQADAEKSMNKRVDHVIFELQDHDKWKLHLIEMKSSVGERKWKEIKGKFRASYLLAQAVGAMLELEISETVMYTTFEKVQFTPPDTMPTGRRGRLGKGLVRMEQEWDGGGFGLNFGQRVSFTHKPIQMKRDKTGVLIGEFPI